MADLLIDSIVGHYQILARLGGGAMGVVYKARDTKLGRLVALKFLPAEWSHDDDAKQRFVREAQAASSTDHANICTVHDIQSTDDGRLFIVMAYYDGQTLKQKLAAGPLPLAEALAIATQVADGLARAHAAGVVHRDIKPGNVIVTEDAVKIVDFGLASLAGSVQLTQVGATMGTVAYMAPEQLRGHAATAQSDVWAVGAMLYEMLAGHPPFQGAYAEAISYAIRHETPPALRDARPEVPEEVEQLVFRALHKEPGVRFASGRELARALRQVQGHTVPLELQTAVVDVPRLYASPARVAAPRRWRALAIAALLLVSVGGLAAWYLSRPPVRTFVAIAPVVNGTGDRILDPYRLGLTLSLTRELRESRAVRVLGYQQLLQPLRRFLLAGGDVSSAEALRAVRTGSGAAYLVVPTLLYDRGAWMARADVQDAAGAVVDRLETAPIESSLTKEAAATLVTALAAQIDARLGTRRWWSPGAAEPPARFQSLDAAQAFEEGIAAYDAGEYADARAAFERAERGDPRHPLPVAWQSRVALIVGDRNGAAEAADRAQGRLEGSPADRVFVEAVVAEARRQDAEALRQYESLAASHPDDPGGLLELAGFQDRSGRAADAVATYRRVIELAPQLPGPALELCRLYNAPPQNDAATARSYGLRAREAYKSLGARGGEAHAMLCLAEILRVGDPKARAEASELAAQALAVFESLKLRYSVSRAHLYVASTARFRGDLPASAVALERALVSAQAVGNTSLEGTVLINLGVTHITLGNRAKALDYYTRSYELAERRGDERRAAYSRANAGALLIEYGSRPDDGVRFVEGALRVVQRLEDKNFEVSCLQFLAARDRFSGRWAESRQGLAQALAIARERNLADLIPSLMLDDARVLIEMGQYAQANDALAKALSAEGASSATDLLVEVGRLRTRLGDFDGARDALDKARATTGATATDLAPRLMTALGELAMASGRTKEARMSFEDASRLWTGELPDAASVEARAYLGFLDGLEGRAGGRAAIDASLRQASLMKRPVLEATLRLLQARLDLHAGRAAAAVAALEPVRLDVISPELRAQVHLARSDAQTALGDAGAAARERGDAERRLQESAAAVPSELRERYLSRPDLRALASLRR